MRLQSFLQAEIKPNGLTDVSSSLQNVKLNGILFDFRFTPDDAYIQGTADGKNAYRVLKNVVVNLNYRDGVGSGRNALLIDRVNLFLLMEFSDYIAGLDITMEPMVAGKEWRACGFLPLGYLDVSENASLDMQFYVKQNPEIACKIYTHSELSQRGLVQIQQYRETAPNGASQTYENVLNAYIACEKEFNDSVSTTDLLDNEVVNVEASIAYSNSVGRFEKFKRFGQFYEDEYNVGQTLTFNCPDSFINSDNERESYDASILLVCRIFNLSTQISGSADFINQGKALMQKIAGTDQNKFKALQLEGANMFGVSLSGE